MSGPARTMYDALDWIRGEQATWPGSLADARLHAEATIEDITPEQLAVMDIAAEVWAADASRPLLRHAELLRAALKVELERRKGGGP